MICAPRRGIKSVISVIFRNDKSRFTIQPTVVSSISRDSIHTVQHSLRLLLLDDNPIFLRAIGRLLESHSFKVQIEECHHCAFDRLSREGDQFDLALVDVGLKGCSGFHFAEKIERLHNAPPVMLMSGESCGLSSQSPSNVKGFISKPFSVKGLIRNISDMRFDAALACS